MVLRDCLTIAISGRAALMAASPPAAHGGKDAGGKVGLLHDTESKATST